VCKRREMPLREHARPKKRRSAAYKAADPPIGMALSASQRVTLLKEIAARLSSEDWSLIDVTLKHFSLPWSNEWHGNKDAYVLATTEDAGDQALLELAQHVGFGFDTPAVQRIDPPFWHKGMFRLFVSHLAAHRTFAGELQQGLRHFGISAFVAHNDIEATLEWQAQIETALATSDALVALLHDKFHQSKWTDQEIGFAMGRGIPVFGIRHGEDPYGFIGRFQAFNGKGKSAVELARELFDAYRKNKQTQRRMSEVVVGLFEQSDSFAEAKSRMGYVEQLEVWEPSFSSRIRNAVKSNSQVEGSWGVPDRVEQLIKKWATTGV
jgi:hypothetical protein